MNEMFTISFQLNTAWLNITNNFLYDSGHLGTGSNINNIHLIPPNLEFNIMNS